MRVVKFNPDGKIIISSSDDKKSEEHMLKKLAFYIGNLCITHDTKNTSVAGVSSFFHKNIPCTRITFLKGKCTDAVRAITNFIESQKLELENKELLGIA